VAELRWQVEEGEVLVEELEERVRAVEVIILERTDSRGWQGRLVRKLLNRERVKGALSLSSHS
jgi:hypothetical protein